ncbi:MAG: hypothetical protein JNK85_04740 [Verrucomicrobiales bacterium]|nr:hypothetical protein [Verrucomicrobiales bacterium]
MIRALLYKEWIQHRGPLAVLMVLVGLGWTLAMLPVLARGRELVLLDQFRNFVLIYGILAASWICHRLIALEYRGRTQLFLEGLPVSRMVMVLVKYGVGVSVFLLLLGSVTLLTLALEAWRHGQEPSLAAMVALRVGAVGWFFFNLCFVLAFAGRYRLAIWIGLLLALLAVHEFTSLRVNEVGPFGLLDQRFAFEREWPRPGALYGTLAGGTLCLIGALVLGWTREGSVAALLAESMSHREKVMVALVLGGGVFAVSVLDERRPKAPFDLPGAATETRPGIVVKVPWEVVDASQRARMTADHLSAIRSFLDLPSIPPVFLVGRSDLDGRHYERGTLDQAEGVHVQANFSAADWDEQRFNAWLIREALLAATRGRSALESRRWILDGFSVWWFGSGRDQNPLETDARLALRACYGAPQSVSRGHLARWLQFREEVGPDIAAAVAWSGLRALERRRGGDALRQVLRRALGVVRPVDGRVLWLESEGAFDTALENAAGWEWQAWIAGWNEDLDASRGRLSNTLAAIPTLECQVGFENLSAESRLLNYQVRFQPPDSAVGAWSFLHAELPAVDVEIPPQLVQRERHGRPGDGMESLPGTISVGARIATTAALEVPALGCEVIAGWTRHEVR